jgi:hypothetical protein
VRTTAIRLAAASLSRVAFYGDGQTEAFLLLRKQLICGGLLFICIDQQTLANRGHPPLPAMQMALGG